MSKINRRSANITEGVARAPNRSMYYALGYQEGDFKKPMIGVANGHSTITPCNSGLQKLADAAVAGIEAAGGNAQIFGTPVSGLANGATTALAVAPVTLGTTARISMVRDPDGAPALSLFTVKGRTNQLLSAPAPSGPWNNEGARFAGTGGRQELTLAPPATNRFFRVTAP